MFVVNSHIHNMVSIWIIWITHKSIDIGCRLFRCRCHFITRVPSNEDRKLGSLMSSLTFGSTFDLEPEDGLAGPECYKWKEKHGETSPWFEFYDILLLRDTKAYWKPKHSITACSQCFCNFSKPCWPCATSSIAMRGQSLALRVHVYVYIYIYVLYYSGYIYIYTAHIILLSVHVQVFADQVWRIFGGSAGSDIWTVSFILILSCQVQRGYRQLRTATVRSLPTKTSLHPLRLLALHWSIGSRLDC